MSWDRASIEELFTDTHAPAQGRVVAEVQRVHEVDEGAAARDVDLVLPGRAEREEESGSESESESESEDEDERVIVIDRPSPGVLLRDTLVHNRLDTMFSRFNAPTTTRVFVALAEVVSTVVRGSFASAALLENGSVEAWGQPELGGDPSIDGADSHLTSGVVGLAGTRCAFAAIIDEGYVVAWGDADEGGDIGGIDTLEDGVVSVAASMTAFAALKDDGSVVAWGHADGGGDARAVATNLTAGVVSVTATQEAFAALKDDGSVVAWGDQASGGDTTAVATDLAADVLSVTATFSAFAALKGDGSVVCWGRFIDTPAGMPYTALTSDVVSVTATWDTFTAMKDDGSVVCWGETASGGDCAGFSHAGMTNSPNPRALEGRDPRTATR